jgi:hypothetical protein
MSFASRIQTNWLLLRVSLGVIRNSPRLLLFPLVSVLCTLVIAAIFLVPVLLAFHPAHPWSSGAGDAFMAELKQFIRDSGRLRYAYVGLIYLASAFLATFFNVALYHEIMSALAGGRVSLGRGLSFALRRLRAIALWSLAAVTVGLVIRMLQEKVGWAGRLVLGTIGLGWSVAAVFAIPVIIRQEESNPFVVLRNSADALKKTWGESLVAYVGIQLGGLMILGVVALSVFVMAFEVAGQMAGFGHFFTGKLVVLTALTEFALVVVAGFLLILVRHIYRCALYVYASEGVVPEPFTLELMNAGWKVKGAGK